MGKVHRIDEVGTRVKLNNINSDPKMVGFDTWEQAGFKLGDAGTVLRKVDADGDVKVGFDTAHHPVLGYTDLYVNIQDLDFE